MSVAAINIVREEIARRKDNQPDVHCAHDMLDTLEARIVDRIEKELVEIPETHRSRNPERMTPWG